MGLREKFLEKNLCGLILAVFFAVIVMYDLGFSQDQNTQSVFSVPREWQEKKEIGDVEESSKKYKGKGRYGRQLTIAMPRTPSFDPQKAERPDVKTIVRCIQEGLYGYNSKNELIPILAERMPEKIEEHTYLIYLQRGVFFHNGDYFEAKDVVFTLKRLLKPKNNFPTSRYFSNILSVKEVGPYTVKLVVQKDYPSLANLLTKVETFPLSKKAVKKYGNDYGKITLVGTGPFIACEYIQNTTLLLRRNFRYRYDWLPYYNSIKFEFFKDSQKALKRLLKRKISIVMGIDTESVSSYAKKYQALTNYKGNGGLLEQIYLNADVPPFNNLNIRKAFFLAIDRRQIVKEVFSGMAEEAKGIFPSWMIFHNKNKNKNKKDTSYNPDKAKEYLADEGYSKENPVRAIMLVGKDENFQKQGKLIKKQVSDIGIDLTISTLSKKELLSTVYGLNGKERNSFQAALEDWEGDESPIKYGYMLYYSKSPYNKVRFNNSVFDDKMETILNRDRLDEIVTLYYEIEQEVIENAVTIPICFLKPTILGRIRIAGLKVHMDGSLDLKEAWTS